MITPPPAYADPTYEEDNVLEVLNQGDAPLVSPLFQDLHHTIASAKSQSRLALMVQSPFRLYAYWDVAARHLKKFLRQFPREDRSSFHLVIRCFPAVPPMAAYYDVGATSHWWFNASPSSSYRVELCLFSIDYGIIPFLKSNSVKTPAISLSPVLSSEESTPAPLPLLEKLIQMSGVAFEPEPAQPEIMKEAHPVPLPPEPPESLALTEQPPDVPRSEASPIELRELTTEEPVQKSFPERPPSSEVFWRNEVTI